MCQDPCLQHSGRAHAQGPCASLSPIHISISIAFAGERYGFSILQLPGLRRVRITFYLQGRPRFVSLLLFPLTFVCLNPDMGELQCCEGHLVQILQPAGCHSGGQSGRLLRLPGSQSCSLVRSPSGDVLVFCSGRPAPPAVFDEKSAAFLCNDKLAAAAPAPQALIPLVMDLPPFHISDGS